MSQRVWPDALVDSGPAGNMADDPPGTVPIQSAAVGDTGRQHREAQILQTGLFYSAARFRIIEGSPAPAEWLEVFEIGDPDPLHAYPRAISHPPPASQIQPQLSESFRLAGTRKTNGA